MYRRVVVDVAERDRIVASLHADPVGGCHYGQTATIRKVTDRFWWRNVAAETRAFVRGCPRCQKANPLGRGVYRLTKENGEDIKQSVNATNLKPWVEQVSPSSTPQKQRTPSEQTPLTSPRARSRRNVFVGCRRCHHNAPCL